MASKKDKPGKLNKLKQAARTHLDETIGGRPPERPPSDMTDFIESMPAAGRDSAARLKPPAVTPPLDTTLVEVESDQSASQTAGRYSAPPAESEEVAKPTPPAPTPRVRHEDSDVEIELPNRGQAAAYAGKAAARPEKSMPKTRDSIYNVSSDIRLEDYTEGSGGSGGGRMGTVAKIGGAIVLLALLGWGGQQLISWFSAPSYRITVANELIDETNAERLGEVRNLQLNSSAPVHIRFDWEEGDLTTDFLRIEILQAASGDVEAAQERKPPMTTNYVYFMGPLDPGSYEIRVLDREKEVLAERDFRVH